MLKFQQMSHITRKLAFGVTLTGAQYDPCHKGSLYDTRQDPNCPAQVQKLAGLEILDIATIGITI